MAILVLEYKEVGPASMKPDMPGLIETPAYYGGLIPRDSTVGLALTKPDMPGLIETPAYYGRLVPRSSQK